jgi:DNA-directed RNA polymerase sigma subunit (sigma70/sigma32)
MGDAADMAFCEDPLRVYLTELARIPPLDRAEENACIEHVKANDDMAEPCRKRLVEANLQLVVTLAERYRDERFHILELIEKGNEGLLHAAASLNDCSPGSFSTHATKFIERALIDAARTDPTIP